MTSQLANCDEDDLSFQMFRDQERRCKFWSTPPLLIYGNIIIHVLVSECVWKICLEPQKDNNSQKGHGWMIIDRQLVIGRVPDLLVMMELIACKCNTVCKGPECQ